MIQYKHANYEFKFNENKGTVTSFKIDGVEYVGGKVQPIFAFQLYHEDLMISILVDSINCDLAKTDKKGNNYVFTYTNKEITDLVVKVYLTVGDEITWDINIDTHEPHYIEWVDFPRLSAPNIDSTAFTSKAVWNVENIQHSRAMSDFKKNNAQLTTFDYSKIPSLKELYKDYFKVGVAVEPRDLIFYKDLIVSQFNELCSENRMKCANIHPEEDVYNFTGMDKIVEFAEEHNMTVRGHGLVYEKTLCDWMFKNKDGSRASKELVLERLEKHVKTIVGRYKGRIQSYDVVNELFGHVDWDTRELTAICGIGFVPLVFKWAHEADPDAILILNDNWYDIPQKRENIYKWVKQWISEGAPIHGIGFQDHHFIDTSLEAIEETYRLFSTIPNFKIYATELDINSYVGEDLKSRYPEFMTDEVLEMSAKKYGSLFDIYRKYADHIETIGLWNVCDARTWLDIWYVRGRKHFALPFGYDGAPTPAFWRIADIDKKLPRWEKSTKPLYIRNNNYKIDENSDILNIVGRINQNWGEVTANVYTNFGGDKKLFKSVTLEVENDFEFNIDLAADNTYDGTTSPDYILEVIDDFGRIKTDLFTYFTKEQKDKFFTVTDTFENFEKTCCYTFVEKGDTKGECDEYKTFVKPFWFWGNGTFGNGEIEYEIPEKFELDKFELYIYTEGERFFKVYTSADGVNYAPVDVKWTQLETNSEKQYYKGEVTAAPEGTRYVKVDVSDGFNYYWHAYEGRLVKANLYTKIK